MAFGAGPLASGVGLPGTVVSSTTAFAPTAPIGALGDVIMVSRDRTELLGISTPNTPPKVVAKASP